MMWRAAIIFLVGSSGCGGDPVDTIGASGRELLNASASGDHPINNAVALSQNGQVDGCTVTLVAPDIVLTARRCFPGFNFADPAMRDGRWYSVPMFDNQPVVFGPRREIAGGYVQNYSEWPFAMSHLPVVNGHDEELVLASFRVLVPGDVAVPRAVQYDAPASSPFNVAVYGYETLTSDWERRFASGTASPFSASDFTNGLSVELSNGASAWPNRDYGAAVFLGSTSGPLVGVITRLNESSLSGIRTYGRGNTFSPAGPSPWGWLRANIQRTFCSSHGVANDSTDTLLGLYQWHSTTVTDHRLSSEDAWKGCDPSFDVAYTAAAGYRYRALEGWVSQTAVSGTSQLKLWHDPFSNDYASTVSSPGWTYSLVRSLGYVWNSSATNRVRLKLYYSSSNDDFISSTTAPGGDYAEQYTIGWIRRADTASPSGEWRDIH